MYVKECIECNRNLEINDYYFKPNPSAKDGFNKKCRECQTKRMIFTDENHKYCNSCQKRLPKNKHHFDIKRCTYDGFAPRCKVCCGYAYTKDYTPSKKGYKICIKCERELEFTRQYFPPDKMMKNGFRNICKECSGSSFMTEESLTKEIAKFSDEENYLFIERYPHYTNAELIELFYPNLTEKQLWDRAGRLKVIKSEETYWRARKLQGEKISGDNHYNRINGFSESAKLKLSNHMKNRWRENPKQFNLTRSDEYKLKASIRMSKLGKWKGENNPRVKNPLRGSSNPNWQGGITPENFKIRNSTEMKEWKIAVFKRDSHTCQRCGNKNYNEAHHIKCFSKYPEYRFDVSNGITLCKFCHNSNFKGSLHNLYGTYNITLEDLREYFTGISWSIKYRKYINNELEDVI